MIENLSVELAKVVAVYKNRSGLFRWNGAKPTFALKDVVRHHLFIKAQASGYTPVPQVEVLQWTIDLVCLRGLRPEIVFLVRDTIKEDYRQLLLFPKTIKKVLVALRDSAVPEDRDEFTVIKVPRRPTAEINIGLSVRQIIAEYSRAFAEVYGFAPLYSGTQLAAPAMKLAAFWLANASDLNFSAYCVWALTYLSGASESDEIAPLTALIDRRLIENFRLSRQDRDYDGEWTKKGWNALDS